MAGRARPTGRSKASGLRLEAGQQSGPVRGSGAFDAAWAYTALECDEAVNLEAWIGAEGPLEIFADGVAVQGPVTLIPTDGHRVGELEVVLRLPAGRSGLLLRVAPGCVGFGSNCASTSTTSGLCPTR